MITHPRSAGGFSALQIGVVWRRFSALMDETAQTFVRTSFSSVVRDNWDLAVSMMDGQGRLFAQSSRSVPSFIGTMPRTLEAMLQRYPRSTLIPGDVLISNDSHLGTGHLNDITMIRPVFRGTRLVAFVGSIFHSVDIGGAPSIDARDSQAEGLTIPISKIVRAGVENEDLIALLEQNLRAPDETLGDIRAQFAAYGVCIGRLLKLLDDERIDDLDQFVTEILARSEVSMRRAIEAIPDGSYSDRMSVDGFDTPLTIQCEVRIAGDTLVVDYAGTSLQIDRPINSVLNFTTAYSAYAIKCVLDPMTPNNDGCFRPVKITAPEGTLLNPRRPAPVWGRHLSGHYLPAIIFSALSNCLPDRVIADCGSPIWNVYFAGRHRNGRRFVKMFFMNGGHGARPDGDGPACLSFPSNIATVSVEQFENSVPLIIAEKALIPDSGGIGKHRGGLAQRLSFRVAGDTPIAMTIRHERVRFPPRGLRGGGPGRPGRDYVNGRMVPAKALIDLQPGDVATFETPGGGGLGRPEERDPAKHRADMEDGYVTGNPALNAASPLEQAPPDAEVPARRQESHRG